MLRTQREDEDNVAADFADEREMKNREGKLSHEFTRMNTNLTME
jgi:hypothetical protein